MTREVLVHVALPGGDVHAGDLAFHHVKAFLGVPPLAAVLGHGAPHADRLAQRALAVQLVGRLEPIGATRGQQAGQDRE